MKYNYRLVCIITLIFLSCHNENTTISYDVKGQNINNIISLEPENSSEILAGQIYHQLHYIPLETNSNSLLDERHVVKIIDNKIGILNINQSNFILFDEDGNFIFSIGSTGQHPGNLSSTYDFTIFEKKIYFPSHSNKSFIIYDIYGEYVESVYVENSYKKLLRTDDFITATTKNLPDRYNSSNDNVAFYNEKLIKILNFGTVPKHLEYIDLYDIVYKSYNKNEIIYHQILSDTIFRINSEGEITYDLIKNNPPFSIDEIDKGLTFNMQNGLFDKYMNNPNATFPIRNIFDSKNYLIIFYMYNYQHYITIHSKSYGRSKTFHFDSDDIRNHVFHPSMDFTALDNTMLIETSIQNFRNVVNLLPEDYLASSNFDVIMNDPNLDENSNPILVTYRLNDDYIDSLF